MAFRHHTAPHSYLVEHVLSALPKLLVALLAVSRSCVPELQEMLSGIVQPWVVQLSAVWHAACSWAPVYSLSFDYFPVASALSRSHGRFRSDIGDGDPPPVDPPLPVVRFPMTALVIAMTL